MGSGQPSLIRANRDSQLGKGDIGDWPADPDPDQGAGEVIGGGARWEEEPQEIGWLAGPPLIGARWLAAVSVTATGCSIVQSPGFYIYRCVFIFLNRHIMQNNMIRCSEVSILI